MAASPVALVREVPVYALYDDLPTEDQEAGNLVVVLESPTALLLWDGTGWAPPTPVGGTDLSARVARLEQRLTLAAERLTEP